MLSRKKSIIAALVLTAAFTGFGNNKAFTAANNYTIDGSTYSAGVADGAATPQMKIDTVDQSSWNLENSDVVNMTGGTLSIQGYDASTAALTNGIITATSGDITVAGGKLTLGTGSSIADAINLTGAGAVDITGGTLNLGSGDTISGLITATSGTLNFTDDTAFSSTSFSVSGADIGVADGKTLTLNDNLVTTGALTNGTNSTIDGTGNLTANSGSNSGTISTSGTFTVGDGSSTGTFTNNGLISSAVEIKSGSTLSTAGVDDTSTPTSGLNANVVNEGSLNVTSGTINGTISGAGSTTIDGDVVLAYGKKVSQEITINSGDGKSLTANVADIGAAVTNNGKLTVFSQEASGSDASKLNYAVSGDGTTVINRNVTVNANLENEINIKSYTEGSDTYNADVIVSDSVTAFGKSGKAITIDENNKLTSKADVLVGSGITNNGTLEFKGGASGAYSANANDITGGGTTYVGNGTDAAYVSNSGAISQAVTVSTNGHFDNVTGGSVSGLLTVNTDGEAVISGGTVADVNNSGKFALAGGSMTGAYSQSAGTLDIYGGSSMELTSTAITGGTINLGKADPASTGSIIFNNGLNTNAAAVTTQGASGITIIGGSEFTTQTGTNVGSDAVVTLGDASTTGKLNIGAGTVNISSNDNWSANGTVNLAGGTLNISDSLVKAGILTSTSGNLNIGNADTTNDTLYLNNTSDSIGTNTVVTIAADGILEQSNGTATLDNGDTWNGAIKLSDAGALTISGRTTEDVTTSNKKFEQTGGSLTLSNSKLKLADDDSKILDGTVNINTASDLTIANTLNSNAAKVVMSDGTVSNFKVQGAGTEFTTLTDSNLATGTVTIGDGTNASKLNLDNNGIIAQAAALNISEASTLNIVGAAAQATLDGANDTWAGIVNQTSGTLNIIGNNSKTGYLTSGGGNLNIGGTSAGTLNVNNANDSITDATVLTIAANGSLVQTKGQVTIDGNSGTADSWLGAVSLGGGTLTLDGRTDVTDAAKTFNQTAGTLSMNNSSLTLGTSASKLNGGEIGLQGDSTLVVNNGVANNSQVKTLDTSSNALTVSGTNTSLQLTGSSEINKQAVVTVGSGATLEVNGTSANGVNLDGASATGDTWAGDVKVTGGVLNISDDLAKTGTLTQTSGNGTTNIVNEFTVSAGDNVTAGTLNVGDGSTNTKLTVSGGTITSGASNAKITIADNATMDITGGTVTLDGGNDLSRVDWQGDVQLNGGSLILANIVDSTRDTTYNKTGTLTANTGNLTINASSVLLGDSDTIADDVVLTLNTANLYIGDDGDETASVYIGTDDTWNGAINLVDSGTLTLDGTTTVTGTNSVNATGGTLNLVNTGTSGHGSSTGVTFGSTSDLIDYAVDTHLSSDLNINAGQVQLDDADTLTSGKITLGGGQLDLTGVSTTNNQLVANTGTLNIQGSGKTTTLNNASGDTIAKVVKTTIDAGSTLKINADNANVTLDSASGSADTWNGALELNAGNLTLDGRTDDLTGTAQTYNQDGGTLTLTGSDLTLHNSASKVTGGTVNINDGSALTFDNGLTTNTAIIKSNTNPNNALTVGGDNATELTLNSASDIDKDTAVTIAPNGTLTAYGDSIKGGSTKGITNDGIFNLSDNGSVAGTIARAVNNAVADGTTGTVNLTGTTLSTSAGTIDQANVNVGDGSGAAGSDKSTFTMGADVTANTLLTVEQDGKIVNAANNIIAEQINVVAGGSIVGDTTEGNLTVKNGGTNAGTISQNNVTLDAGTLHNTGSMTSNGTFTNKAASTVDNNGTEGAGTLNVFNGSNAGSITQGNMTIASGNTGFDNDNSITVETKLDNQGTFNNNKDITVANSTNNASLTNTGTINSTANSTITADTLTNTGGTMNLTKSTVAIVYQADDIKGIVNVLGADASTDKTDLTITGTTPTFSGTMNIGDVADAAIKSTLNLKSGSITEAAALSIASGNVLNVDDTGAPGTSAVVIDGANDTYAGDVTLASGAVTMKDLTVTTGKTSTTAGGTSPYYAQTGGDLTLTNSTLSMADSSLISGGNLTVDKDSTFNSLSNSFSVANLTNAGLINGINNGYENYAVSTGLYAGDGLADNQGDFTVDLRARSNASKNYDTYGSDSATIYAKNGSDGVLNVSDWALRGDIFGYDAPIDRNISMNKLFKGSVASGHTINFTSTDKEIFTPIGWYKLNSVGGGNYSFDLTKYNPAVFRGQITKIAQYQNQLAIDDMLFNHTMLDQGFKGNDYITSNPNKLASAGDLYPPYQYSRKDGGLWVKMYGTFEKLNMNRGLSVGNNAYGTLIGADFGLKDLRNGWQFMPTAYIGYNGAHQYWNGNGAYQNGAQLGFLGTWYKNNFMIGALAFGGFYGNDMNTPRGDDNTFNYFAGGSVKAAYNWKFAKDWSLQPNLLVAYSFFGKENWHTDFGQMGMMSGMLHGINIAPGLNLIWEKETFSAYATVQYMYNVNQSVGGRAGNVGLPHVHMDRGYIQYGVGVNKKFSDKFAGYLQAVVRNAGRTGVGLQAGFQWQLGKKSKKGTKANVTPELNSTKIVLKGNK